jgi:pimeloyl-ACP methyl ester carboxylesterase
MRIQPFKFHATEYALKDLRIRLQRARIIDDPQSQWEYGTSTTYLHELRDYWLDGYNWRAHETRINEFPQFRTNVEGIPVHFLQIRGVGPNPVPLLLTHGWPWTFWDYQKVIGPLSDPARHGGNAADAFDVIVPSLPGFAFSTPLHVKGVNFWRTADLWAALMRDYLGYGRFAAHGGDWGAFVTAQLGHKYTDRVIAIHLQNAITLSQINQTRPGKEVYAPEEAGWFEKNGRFTSTGSAYAALQFTCPQTLANALHDSPLGLCSWLVEKRRAWSDCGGDVERRFTKDDLLTSVMLYWLTDSIGTSFRFYAEYMRNPWTPSHPGRPVVPAATGIAIFPNDIFAMPKRFASEYYNLKRWSVLSSGGHFGPMEEPTLLVAELRSFFRDYR